MSNNQLQTDDLTHIAYHSEQIVSANNLNLTYDCFGNAEHPVMLLIMGLGTQLIHWNEDFCRLLASKGFYVIRFDNRDIGKSTWLEGARVPSIWRFLSNAFFNQNVKAPYLLNDMANDTLALLDALNVDQAHIVGASMGGMIAQCMALQAPEKIASLTSIMSTTGDRSLPKAKTKVSAKLLKPMAKDLEKYVEQALDVWGMLHGSHFSFEKSRIEQIIKESRQRGFNPPGVARQLSAIVDSPDRTEALRQLNIPTLVIHGDNDVLVPVECGIATAKAIPNARLQILKGMGHTLPTQLWPQIVEDISDLAKAS